MRAGVLLPVFQEDTAPALERAMAAERAGVDGVFCYDQLWPIGQPGRPALAPFPWLRWLPAGWWPGWGRATG